METLRRALLLDFGDLVDSLGGSYVTAEDVGTGAPDMEVIAERTSHVVGLDRSRGGSGDPSPLTALGVLAAIRACASSRWGSHELAGRRIAVVGLGHVGGALAGLLTEAGAELICADIDPARRALAERLGAVWLEPADALRADCDVLAPCALGGVVTAQLVDQLGCEVLCGAANNILAEPSAAASLQRREILYAPDFIVNSGGLISVYAELRGLASEWVRRRAEGIEQVLGRVLEEATLDDTSPLIAAERIAAKRLEPKSTVPH